MQAGSFIRSTDSGTTSWAFRRRSSFRHGEGSPGRLHGIHVLERVAEVHGPMSLHVQEVIGQVGGGEYLTLSQQLIGSYDPRMLLGYELFLGRWSTCGWPSALCGEEGLVD